MSEAKIIKRNLVSGAILETVLQNERGAKKSHRFNLGNGVEAVHGPDIGSSVQVGGVYIVPGEASLIDTDLGFEIRVVHEPLVRKFVTSKR